MRWEELKTPESVLAAFAAGRRVEYRHRLGRWVEATPKNTSVAAMRIEFADGHQYRALIEEPAIPAGYTPWGGGECPEDARGKVTRVIFRDGTSSGEGFKEIGEDWHWRHNLGGSDIIAYRVEQAQPSQQGEAVSYSEREKIVDRVLSEAFRAGDDGRAFDMLAAKRTIREAFLPALPIPVESLGRDADDRKPVLATCGQVLGGGHPDFAPWCTTFRERLAYQHGVADARAMIRDAEGVEGLASDDVVIERHWLENIASAACLLEGSGSIIDRREGEALRNLIKSARRLRPQVECPSVDGRICAVAPDKGRVVVQLPDADVPEFAVLGRIVRLIALTAALTEADSHGK